MAVAPNEAPSSASTPSDVAPCGAGEMEAAQRFLSADPDAVQVAVFGPDGAATAAASADLLHDAVASEPRPLPGYTCVEESGHRMTVSSLPAPSPGIPRWSDVVDEFTVPDVETIFVFVGNPAQGNAARSELQSTANERWHLQGAVAAPPDIPHAFAMTRPTRHVTRHAAGNGLVNAMHFVTQGQRLSAAPAGALRLLVSGLTPVRWPQPLLLDGSRGVTPSTHVQAQQVAGGNDVNSAAPRASLGAAAAGAFVVSVPTTPADESASSNDSGSTGGAAPAL